MKRKGKEGEYEVPTGTQCHECATVASLGFRHQSWHQLVCQAKTNPHLEEAFRIAKAVVVGKQKPSWCAESVAETNTARCRIVHSLLLLSEEEFETHYDMKLKAHPELQALFVSLPGLGGDEKFLVMTDPSSPCRKLVMESSTAVSSQSQLMKPDECLRPGQSRDVAGMYEGPKLRPFSGKPLAAEKVQEMVTAAKEKLVKVAAQTPAPAVAAKEPAPLLSPKKEEKDSDDDMDDADKESPAVVVSKVAAPLVPAALHAQDNSSSGKGQRRGSGKGAGRGAAGKAASKAKAKPSPRRSQKRKGPPPLLESEPPPSRTNPRPSHALSSFVLGEGGRDGASDTQSTAGPASKAAKTAAKSGKSAQGDTEYFDEQYRKWFKASLCERCP